MLPSRVEEVPASSTLTEPPLVPPQPAQEPTPEPPQPAGELAHVPPQPAQEPPLVLPPPPYDIVTPEMELAVNLELQVMETDDIEREMELAQKHPAFEAYVKGIRLHLGETDATPKECFIWGEDFDDLVLFKGYLLACDRQKPLAPETIPSSLELAPPVPGDEPPYTGPSMVVADTDDMVECAPSPKPDLGDELPAPAPLPVVPLEKALASVKFSAAVVEEFHNLLNPRDNFKKRFETLTKMDDCQIALKADQIREHPTCPSYNVYIDTLTGEQYGAYKFGTGQSDDIREEVAMFEFWVQAEMNVFKKSYGTTLVVDAPYDAPLHVPPTATPEACSAKPLAPTEVAPEKPMTPMRALEAVLTRATTVDLQHTATMSPTVRVPPGDNMQSLPSTPGAHVEPKPPPSSSESAAPDAAEKLPDGPSTLAPLPSAVESSAWCSGTILQYPALASMTMHVF